MPAGLDDSDRRRVRREWAESPRGREVHESVKKYRKAQRAQEWSEAMGALCVALAACAIIFLMIVGTVAYFS